MAFSRLFSMGQLSSCLSGQASPDTQCDFYKHFSLIVDIVDRSVCGRESYHICCLTVSRGRSSEWVSIELAISEKCPLKLPLGILNIHVSGVVFRHRRPVIASFIPSSFQRVWRCPPSLTTRMPIHIDRAKVT